MAIGAAVGASLPVSRPAKMSSGSFFPGVMGMVCGGGGGNGAGGGGTGGGIGAGAADGGGTVGTSGDIPSDGDAVGGTSVPFGIGSTGRFGGGASNIGLLYQGGGH